MSGGCIRRLNNWSIKRDEKIKLIKREIKINE